MVGFRSLSVFCAVAALAAAAVHGAAAQGWGWGWGDNRGYDNGYSRYESQPGNGQPPVYGQPGYGQQPGGYGQPGAPQPQAQANPRCRELEYQLSGGGAPNAGDQLPRIEADMRQADAQYHRAQDDAERANCYEDMFLFGRSLRRTPRCIDLDRQAQSAKASLGQLKAQRDAIVRGSSSRGRHDDLIADLARNHCGEQYAREYNAQRSRSGSIFSFFSDEESDETNRWSTGTANGANGYGYGASGSYRTLCVRECDGFYFPISTATSQSQFQEDDAKCHSLCAAPAELYYHSTDQDVDQMVSLKGAPYSQAPNAFRNRKVYIKGCSCNASEYSREEIAKSEEALRTSKRADAGKAPADTAAFARRISQAVQNAPSKPQQPAAGPAPAQPAPPANPAPAPDAVAQPGSPQH
jgi:hypothetical protein